MTRFSRDPDAVAQAIPSFQRKSVTRQIQPGRKLQTRLVTQSLLIRQGFQMRIVNIALLGSGFVAEFFMQGLANVNGQRVVVNYSRSRKRAQEFARRWNIPE